MPAPLVFPFLLPSDEVGGGVSKITDHAARAISRLAQQYQKLSIQNLVSALAGPAQDLENALFDLLTLRALPTATGIQLDQVGRILGQPRGNFPDDDTYRQFLRARVLLNRSSSTPEEIYTIFKTARPGSALQYWERYPAAFALFMYQVVASNVSWLAQILNQARAGGVRAMFEWSLTDEFNTFACADGTGLGLADVAQTSGGMLAGAVDSQGY